MIIVNPDAMFCRGDPVQIASNNLEQLIQLSGEVVCINGSLSQIEWDILCLGELDMPSNLEAQATNLKHRQA